jgi:hypothetical protein
VKVLDLSAVVEIEFLESTTCSVRPSKVRDRWCVITIGPIAFTMPWSEWLDCLNALTDESPITLREVAP